MIDPEVLQMISSTSNSRNGTNSWWISSESPYRDEPIAETQNTAFVFIVVLSRNERKRRRERIEYSMV